MTRPTRRDLLKTTALGFCAIASSAPLLHAAESFEIQRSDVEWKKLLTPDQFAVLRKSATEGPYTSPLLHEERPGTFACAGCQLDLFASTTKFDSQTGWPSFWAPWTGRSARPAIRRSARSAPRSIAAAVAAISDTCSTTDRSRPGCATA
jgi:peptide methionine sulfoxide reductase MsrB